MTIDTINSLAQKPDFIVFTGDLTHNTDDPFGRRRRMTEFEGVISKLNVKNDVVGMVTYLKSTTSPDT